MSKRTVYRKETMLSITFVEEEADMIGVMKMLGAPNTETTKIGGVWEIKVIGTTGSVKTADDAVVEMIRENASEIFEVRETFTERCDLSAYKNLLHLESMFAKVDDGKRSIETTVNWIGERSIPIVTEGIGASKTAVENLHRKNVLVLKDKIVACPNVQRVDYTCSWKQTKEETCIV